MHEKEGNQTNKILFAELCVISFEMYIFQMLNAELEEIVGNVGLVL